MTAAELAEHLCAKRAGKGWTARCPAHEDSTPSLSISEGREGRTLVKCHAGCTTAEILQALGKTEHDLFPDGSGNGHHGSTLGEEVAAYDYRDENGTLLYQVVRYRLPKDFRQRRPDGRGRWIWKLGDVRRVLYRLPELLQRSADALVWIVEGEKDTDVLAALGLTATTNPGGAGKWRSEYGDSLKGADVCVVPDNDRAGRDHARDVARRLYGVAARVRIVAVPKGKDASEYLEMGGAVAELVALAKAAPDWTPAGPATAEASTPVPADTSRTPEQLGISKQEGRIRPAPQRPTAPLTPDEMAEPEVTLTDTGNATRLVSLHGDRLHYIAAWGKWLVWTAAQGRWNLDHRDVQVRELAKDVGRSLKDGAAREANDDGVARRMFAFALKSLDTHGISGMVDLARGIDGIQIGHEALDRDGWALGVQNGVVDLRTGTLRPANPADLMMMQAPVACDTRAQAPRWQRALAEWFPDTAVRAFVQRVAGAALVVVQRDHVFVIHYGGGRNGKGTFVRALQRVLGPYAGVIHLSLLVESKYAQHDTVRAALFRTRLAVASETQRRVKLDEASVKNLTGGDRITARRMREDLWEFDPTHSLWLQTNHLPEISGRDRGIWSRIRVIKWDTTFAERQQDRTLDATLAAEAPGILRWLIEGCLEWQRVGLAEPEAVVRETLAYRKSEDTFARFATENGLFFRRGLEIQAGELQRLLTDWAGAEGIDPRRRELGAWLEERGARKQQRRERGPDGEAKVPRYWRGVGIVSDEQEEVQTDALS